MKRIISGSLLVLCFLNTFGLLAVFKLMRFRARDIAQQSVAMTSPDKFTIFRNIENSNGVVWETGGKEFSMHEKMYDIAKDSVSHDIHYYYCYDDKEESAAKRSIEALVNAQFDNDKTPVGNTALHVLLLLTQTFIPSQPILVSLAFFRHNTKTGSSHYLLSRTAYISDIQLPPPRA